MSILLNLYRKLLNLPLSLLVKSRSIPTDPITELALNREQPLIYVLPYTSQSDLLILQRNCRSLSLPDPLEQNVINGISLPRFVFLNEDRRIFKSKEAKSETVATIHRYLDLHKKDINLDVQLIPVSVLWGRAPGKEKAPSLRALGAFSRIFSILWYGRDNFVRFSQAVSLNEMVANQNADEQLARKLARIARMHFAKQRYSAMGPQLPDRQAMFNKLLDSDVLKKAIADEAESTC